MSTNTAPQGLDIRFHAGGDEKWSADVAIIPVWEDEKILETCPKLLEAAPFLEIAPAMRDVRGKSGELVVVYGHPDLPYSRVLFIGMGKDKSGRENAMDVVRKAVAQGVRKARAMGLKSAHIPYFTLERLGNPLRVLEECVYAAVVSNHRNGILKKKSADKLTSRLEWLAIGFYDNFVPDDAREAARRGERAGLATTLARDLGNLPANVLFPAAYAERASELAKEHGLKCEVLDEKELERQGFNAHLAVGKGGANPPRLVVLEYAPKGHEDDAPIVYVGKGITFDTGGISLKPAANMHAMKTDMTGSAAVLAALLTIADEGLPRRVVGVLPLAENMPDGNAVRPGDIVTGYSGDTIEIVNTDAEGRLVLCDAIAYAIERFNPKYVIDIATLTGAIMVALGDEMAGLFCNDDAMSERILSASHCAGEEFWRMPLKTSYRKKLDSPAADICHSASGRAGGSITAALFLKHFVKQGVSWAHLDIASVDWLDKATMACDKGSTGFGARTLLEIARGGLE